MVTFDYNKCVVTFNEKGFYMEKNLRTDMWTLPLGNRKTRTTAQHDLVMPVLACPNMASAHMCLSMQDSAMDPQSALFTDTVRNRANSTKFSHQLLCSLQILILLKSIRRGFLKGFPNLTTAGVT
jgi:hypothetical protein